MKNIILIVLLFLVSLQAKDLQKVSLQLHWKYQFEFAGFIAAKEKGFYKDVGLDVALKEAKPNIDIVDEVVKGRATYGLSNSNILIDYLDGKPIKLLASFLKRSALVLITKPSIKGPKDLIGKTIMAGKKRDFNTYFKYLFQKSKVDINSVHLIKHTFNINDFIDGKCDAMTAFISDQPYTLDKKGIKYNIFNPSDYGIYNTQLELFTSKKEARVHPKRTQAFIEASIKGWEYAFNHIDEIINIIHAKYNTHLSKEKLKYEAKMMKKIIEPNVYEIGSIQKDFIKKQVSLFGRTINKSQLENYIFKTNEDVVVTKLNKIEKSYLKNKKELKLCVQTDKMPFSDVKNGKAIGMVSGYFDIFKKKLGVDFKVVKTDSLDTSIKMLKTNRCDIITTIQSNKEIYGVKLTKEYIKSPLMLAIGSRVSFITDFRNLENKKIGISKNLFLGNKIKRFYPNATLTKVNSLEEGLFKVNKKELFGQIGSLAQMAYLFEKDFRGELKIAGKSDDVNLLLSMGISDKNKILYEIMQKSIKNLNSSVNYDILNRWFAIKYEGGIPAKILWMIVFVTLFLLLIIFIFVKKNKELKLMHSQVNDLNDSLEIRIKDEIEKNKQQQLLMLHQSRLAQMGEMISMIAHQWRQPLAAISATSIAINLKAKLNKLDKDTAIELSDKISDYSQHLSSTIDDFRDFFKPNKERKETNFTKLVQSVFGIIEDSIQNHNIKIIKDLECDKNFISYPNELKQVILNLLKNAEDVLVEKDIPNPTIKISSYSENENIILEINDNGGGIPLEIIDNIFDPYFSTKTEKNGTGLGLYMSKTIIETHCGGTLSVINSVEGAVFRVVLKTDTK